MGFEKKQTRRHPVHAALFHMFQHNKQDNVHALCFTAGTDVPASWLNALNVERLTSKLPSERLNQEISLDPPSIRQPIRARLEKIGVPFKKKNLIRVAPVRGSTTNLES